MLNKEWMELRERLLFSTTALNFGEECEKVRESYNQEYDKADETRREQIADIMAEITIDIQSYLLRWNLQSPEKEEKLKDSEVEQQVKKNCELLKKWGTDEKLKYVEEQIDSVGRSNFMNISRMEDEGVLSTRWGNDYGTGIMEAMRRGAVLVTTNPPIVNMTRKDNPAYWDKVRDQIKSSNPDASHEELVSLFTMQVVLQNCRELRPVFEATNGELGYVSYQVNPYNSNKPVEMAEEIEFVYNKLQDELKGIPNVVFKVPGTKASLETVKRVTAKGIGVNITVSFSIAQHLEFAKVIEEGNAKVSFVVMMSGRLDGPIKEELQKLGLEDSEEVSKMGSCAVTRKSYDVVYCKNKFKKSAILVASLRGPWNIEASLTHMESPIFISSFPDKWHEYDSVGREIASTIDEKVPDEVLEKLMRSETFRKAYNVEELPVEKFDEYYPVVVTLNAFKEVYNELKEYMG